MNVVNNYPECWKSLLVSLSQDEMLNFNNNILNNCKFYPERKDIFKVFETDLKDIKVIIIGQDPHHFPNGANGRAFAVNPDVKMTSTLSIMRKTISKEFGTKLFNRDWKTLQHWQEQGVFLLNSALTVEAGSPGSHLPYWEKFIIDTIKYISSKHPCIWLIWGKPVQKFGQYIANKEYLTKYDLESIKSFPVVTYKNYVIETSHPMIERYRPSTSTFSSSKQFKMTNEILKKQRKERIVWESTEK